MIARFNALIRLGLLFQTPANSNSYRRNSYIFTPSALFATALPCCETQPEKLDRTDNGDRPKDAADVLRKWGCSESDISRIFMRRPSLRDMDIVNLQSRLKILKDIGLKSTDLVKIVHCRPRFLNCRINRCLDERLQYFRTLFSSEELLIKAILRNPSLLTYDFNSRIKPIVEMYERVGVNKKDLTAMLLSRPTIIPRSTLDEEKMDLIRRTGVNQGSRMYKYVVTLIAVSRIETIRDKVAYLEKFGFSEDEVLLLFGRSPLVLTLSTEKVQRNMTFILGTMKLPAAMVLSNPCLLFSNLENVLKPRFLLAGKIEDMGLDPRIKGPAMLRALRMKEDRFIRAFIGCHAEDVSRELMEFYRDAKCIKRLAESSKKSFHKGFPF